MSTRNQAREVDYIVSGMFSPKVSLSDIKEYLDEWNVPKHQVSNLSKKVSNKLETIFEEHNSDFYDDQYQKILILLTLNLLLKEKLKHFFDSQLSDFFKLIVVKSSRISEAYLRRYINDLKDIICALHDCNQTNENCKFAWEQFVLHQPTSLPKTPKTGSYLKY